MISSRVFLPTPRMNRTSPTGRSRSWRTVGHADPVEGVGGAGCSGPASPPSVSGSAWSSSTSERDLAAAGRRDRPPLGQVGTPRARPGASPRRCRTAAPGRGRSALRKKAARPVADRRVEPLGLDRQLGVGQRRVGLAVAPAGQDAGGHLVERHAGRVPLGRQVPARRPALRRGTGRGRGACPTWICSAGARDSEKSNRTSWSRCLPERTPMLSGLMSRWATPCRSSEATAWSRSSPNRWSSSRPSRPSLRSRSASVSSPGLVEHQDRPAARSRGPRAGRR